MSDEVTVILDLSHDAQTLLDQQEVDLYQELQRKLSSIRLSRQTDPEAPPGSRDIVTVISVTTGLVGALTPVILRILNMITPPNRAQTWVVEETETLHPDGSRTIHRKRVLSSNEQRLSEPQVDPSKALKPPSSADTTGTNEQ
jgi:hypothetical protein